MAVLRDYRCTDCDTVSEHMVKPEEVATLPCPKCGYTALVGLIGAAHISYIKIATDGKSSSDSMRTSIDKWAKMRTQQTKIEKRNLERHGTVD